MSPFPVSFLTHGRWLLHGLLLAVYGLACGLSACLLVGYLVERQFDVELDALIGIDALMLGGLFGLGHALVSLWSHISGDRR